MSKKLFSFFMAFFLLFSVGAKFISATVPIN